MKSVTAAIVALHQTAGILVDVGRKPSGGGWVGSPGKSTFTAYAVVHPGSGVTDGPITEADAWVDRDYQVTYIAGTADGAETLAGRGAAAMSGGRIITDDRQSTVPITVERWGPVDRDDSTAPEPSVFMVAHVFAVPTAPLATV